MVDVGDHRTSSEPGFRRSAATSHGLPRAVDGEFRFDLDRVRRVILIALVAVVVLDVLASIGAAARAPWFLTRFFDGDLKTNVPTGFKTTFLLADALLLTALAALARRTGDRFLRGWQLLAFTTFFAFVDETIYLHQSMSEVLAQHLHTSGPLAYAWTIVYLPMAAAVGITLLRYLRYLPTDERWPLLSTGALYAIGAVCFEPFKSEIAERYGDGHLLFKLVAAASDSCEMIGMALLCIVLLGLLATRTPGIGVHFEQQSLRGGDRFGAGRHSATR